MTRRTHALVMIAILAVFDTVIPIPFTALLVIYAIVQRPPWAIELVKDIYGHDALKGEGPGSGAG